MLLLLLIGHKAANQDGVVLLLLLIGHVAATKYLVCHCAAAAAAAVGCDFSMPREGCPSAGAVVFMSPSRSEIEGCH